MAKACGEKDIQDVGHPVGHPVGLSRAKIMLANVEN